MIRVIILEADRMVRQILCDVVNNVEGFQILKTVDRIEQLVPKADLIIGETVCADGMLCEWIEKQRCKGSCIDFLPVTGEAGYTMYRKCAGFGAVDYIIKPFETSRLKRTLMRYRRWKTVLMPDANVSQSQLDRFYDPGNQHEDTGISMQTYQRIYQYICNCKTGCFTSKEAALEMKISPVTMRRYLEYMHQKGLLKVIPQYGKVGRPILQYYMDHSKNMEDNHENNDFSN